MRWIAAGFALGMTACKVDTNVTGLVPEIVVTEDAVDFGDVPVLTTATHDVVVSNGGRAPLDATISVDGDAYGADVTTLSLGADEDAIVTVSFTPTTYLPYTGTLSIVSNDLETARIDLPLTGNGVPAPTPDISITPQVLDFGPLAPPGQSTLYFTIANVGDAPLHLGVVGQEGSGAFQLLTDPSDQEIAPDGQLPVIVAYQPSSEDGDNGTLTIASDDPDEGSVVVQLLGNGGGDAAYPIAVVACPDQVDPPVIVALDGTASTDPNGHLPLTYAWTIAARPTGSQASLTEDAIPTTQFFADLAGDYDVTLSVTNALGVRSAPARCRIAAVPADLIHVELVWDGPRSDLDLHLAESGSALFERPGDCNWCNRSPAWGASLDLDDRSGLGPENINVREPANGAYDVAVHYFDDNGDGSVIATVRVWTYGVLASERSHRVERNEVWNVGRVNWPDGTVGVVDTIGTATARACY